MDEEKRKQNCRAIRTFDADLALAIGLNGAIVVAQVLYWMDINQREGKNLIDGRYWVYNTYEEWRIQFPFWSVRTIKTIFHSLEELGVLKVGRFNKLNLDRTKWYTVDEEAISRLCKSCTMDSANLAPPIPKITYTKDY